MELIVKCAGRGRRKRYSLLLCSGGQVWICLQIPGIYRYNLHQNSYPYHLLKLYFTPIAHSKFPPIPDCHPPPPPWGGGGGYCVIVCVGVKI